MDKKKVVLALGTAGLGALAYLALKSKPAGGVSPEEQTGGGGAPTPPEEQYAFEAKCPESVKETKDIGRCWNWLHSHTYFPFKQLTGTAVWHVDKIDCKLKAGPSEFNIRVPIRLEVQKEDGNWYPITTFQVMAYKGEPESFTAEINDNITGVRFVSDAYFVDYSAIKVYGYPVS